MAVALLALFVALGGTGYAALKLPKNSVGNKQIKKNAVRASEIKKNAVKSSEVRKNAIRSSEVKNKSLRADDFADDELPAGPSGPVGPAGPTGPTGATGAKGATGAAGSARAYGAVSSSGVITRSKGVTGDATKLDGSTFCIPIDSSIDMDGTVLITGTHLGGSATDTTADNKVFAEWTPGSVVCPAGSEQVNTYVYQGDSFDDFMMAGTETGDSLVGSGQPFTFMVP